MNNAISTKENDNDATLDQTELNYIKANTHLSLKHILDYYKKFLSKYNSGFVNRAQFVEIIKKLFIDGNNASLTPKNSNINNKNNTNKNKENDNAAAEKLAICERLFDICDQDDNGSIDFKEYLVLFWSKVNGSAAEKLALIFDMYDLNSSGYIDFHELHSIVKVLFKLKYSTIVDLAEINFPIEGVHQPNASLPSTYHIAMNIMRKFDCNRNAKLTKEEFVNGCLSHENIKVFLTPLKVL